MSAPALGLPRAEPRYFGPADRPRFGWLHRPSASSRTRATGIVVCNPLGYVAICAHRSLRHFAETAAGLGHPALRFDYDGAGDSAGEDLDPNRLEAWKSSVLDAVRELKSSTGVERVCLLGVRLGAMIAALAASEAEEISGLVLLAPVANGRIWLREMRALQAAMGRVDAPTPFALPEQVHESVGLLFSEATREAIAATDFGSLAAELPKELLVIDRSDRPPLTGLVEQFRAGGATVRHAVLPGFVEMTLDPHDAVLPTAMLAEFGTWLTERFPAERAGTPAPDARRSTDRVPIATGVTEQATFIDEASRLFGIISAPTGARPTRAVLLLNSGANHHIGNGRMYVKYARRLAAQGWLVLRYDVSGIGDSTPHAGAPENEVYTPHALEDLRTALEFLRGQHGVTDVQAVGLCSGAYHAFKGAVAGLALRGIVVVNPLVFFWKRGMSLAYPPFLMVQAAAQYKRSMFDVAKWVKLFRGQVDLFELGRVLANRVAERARGVWREVARALGIALTDDLAAELGTITQRSVALRFIFSVGDAGEPLLRAGAGSRLRAMERRGELQIDHMKDCDHSLSSAWMHEALWALLDKRLNGAERER